MTEKFDLSKKREEDNWMPNYPEKDVKEFIRRLKEYFFDDETMYKGKKIKIVIDKLAGKLADEGK